MATNLHCGHCRGFSLVGMLVAFAIVGMLAAISTSYFKNSATVTKVIDSRNDVEQLRRLIRVAASCPATLDALPSNCGKNTKIRIKKGGSPPTDLISIPHSVISKYKLRARCTPKSFQFNIEFKNENQQWSRLFPADMPFSCRAD